MSVSFHDGGAKHPAFYKNDEKDLVMKASYSRQPVAAYTVAGAIAILPNGLITISGGGALAMTLVNPTTAQNGIRMTIVAQSAHAHTVAAASAFQGQDTGVTATFNGAVGDVMEIIAIGGRWVAITPPLGGIA